MTATAQNTIRRITTALICLTGSVLLVNALLAQTPQKSQPKSSEAPPNELAVVPLKHAEVGDLHHTLTELFADGRAGASLGIDQRTNAIIITAPAGKISEIKDLITKLDVPVPTSKRAGSELRVFTLRNINPDKSLETALKLVLGARGLAPNNAAIDPTRSQVIVSADVPTLEAVEAFLARWDVQSARRSSGDVQLRVVWLVKSPAEEEYASPPDDLKDVLPALAKLGVEKPRVAAQTLITVSPNSPFRADGTLHLGEPCRFSVSGTFNDRTDAPSLNISLRATAGSNAEICNVSTDITAPLGHLVVLGITPTRSMTSAFVVQIVHKEAAAVKP